MSELAHRMFLPQSTLEAWVDAGTAHMDGDGVVVRATGERFDLEPAVRFVETLPEQEASQLLDRVAAVSAVVESGGELLGDSVLFGDAGFTIEHGFIAARAG